MFGLNTYAIYAISAIVLFCAGFVSGCQHQQSSQEKAIRAKEHQYQADADKLRTEKDAQIKAINNQLVDAVSELRKRTSRSSEASDGSTAKGCDGSKLYAEDAEFLIRFSRDTEELKTQLKACYAQYDIIYDQLNNYKSK